MHIYLPIAEMPVNILAILALGAIAGVFAGMFGVGGGFLLTPFLIFFGIPHDVAVSSSANQIIASSVSGFSAHWRKRNVDVKMGLYLLAGGMVGSTSGVSLFSSLKASGQIDVFITVCYIIFLGVIGAVMAIESGRAMLRKRAGEEYIPKKKGHNSLQKLPFKTRFPDSKLYISALLPITLGFAVGVLVSVMGIGGGFIMIPAMIYILGMPTSVVIGTSLFQIIFITSNVTMLMAYKTQTVDIVLALILIAGSVFGAQIGTKLGMKIPSEKLRAMLAMMVLSVCLKLAYGLFVTPPDIYTITEMGIK